MWLKFSPLGSGTSALTAISSTLHVSSKWGSRHLHSNLVGKGKRKGRYLTLVPSYSPLPLIKGDFLHITWGLEPCTKVVLEVHWQDQAGEGPSRVAGWHWAWGSAEDHIEALGPLKCSAYLCTPGLAAATCPHCVSCSSLLVLCLLGIQAVLHKALKYQIEKSMLAGDAA